MYNDTVTLFNRYESRLGDTWYPTILRGVNLLIDKAAIIAKYGPDSSDSAVLNVRYRNVGGKKIVGDKIWLPPKEWDKQTNDSFARSITFTDGTEFDFFILGEWEGGEDPVSDDDYQEGFYNEINRSRDYVFAISSVGGPYHSSIIPHFEIMGK